MKVTVRLKLRRRAETRAARLKRVLTAARDTSLYGPLLRGGESTETALRRISPVSVAEFDLNIGAGQTRRLLAQELHYPLDPEPRIAILEETFRQSPTARIFVDCDRSRISSWRVDTVAAPLPDLRGIAALGRVLFYPAIVFTGLRHGLLTSGDRQLFWNAFQAPVFEQFLGVHGEVIAEECEAHEGLHIREENALVEEIGGQLVYTSLVREEAPAVRIATGLAAGLEETGCGCGRPGMRIVPIALPERAVAACA